MVKKAFIIIILIMTIVMCFNYISYASTISEELGDLDEYKGQVSAPTNGKFLSKVGVVLGVIQAVGMIVSVVVASVVGIKYMMGSIEEKAEYKKTAISYVIGAIFVFSITTVPEVIYQFVNGIASK